MIRKNLSTIDVLPALTNVLGNYIGAGIVSYTADPDDDRIELCGSTCDEAQVIPQPVVDVVDIVARALDGTLCGQVLSLLSPGIGPVVIEPDGDTFLFSTHPGNQVWECPPYEH